MKSTGKTERKDPFWLRWFDYWVLCRWMKSHPVPTSKQFLQWLDCEGYIKCRVCGKDYSIGKI